MKPIKRPPGRPPVWNDDETPRHNFIIRCSFEEFGRLKEILPSDLYERYKMIKFVCEHNNKEAHEIDISEG